MTKFTEIQHSSHRHRLTLVLAQTPYRCDGCKELGFEACYRCNEKECDFHLHEECASASGGSATHHLFKKGKFKFHGKSPAKNVRPCVACGKDVQGFRYQSLRKKAHVLHPSCFRLPHNMSNNGVNLNLRKKAPSKCQKCLGKKISSEIKGWTYVSTCGKYCYHVACVKDLILESWKKGYFHRGSDGESVSNRSLGQQAALPDRKDTNKHHCAIRSVMGLIISAIIGSGLDAIIGVAMQSLFLNQ